jgi:hypothetical protein
MTTRKSRTADAIRTGLSMRSAKPGALARTSIPIATGTRTTAKTCSSFEACIPTEG